MPKSKIKEKKRVRARTLIRNRSGKTNWTPVVMVIIAIVLLSGTQISIPKLNIQDWLGIGAGNLVNVNKKLTLTLTDVYAGSALTSKSVKLYVGTTLKESLTTGADGTVNSGFPYESGTAVSFLYVDSNTKQWFHLTVPKMNPLDAESANYNTIGLESFSVCTLTDDVRCGGTSYADASTFNISANTNPSFTYDFFVASDNTGFISSTDPIYGMGWNAVVYMSLSGTGYEAVLPYQFGSQFDLGTTHWSASVIPDQDITKYKVGYEYVHDGEGHFNYNLEASGLTTNGTTMQLYLKIYSDPSYMQTHGGNFGPDVVELAEQTISLLVYS